MLAHRITWERFSEGQGTIKGAEIFAAGTHRGKRYSIRDLDDMAENFRRFSTPDHRGKILLEVPAVPGHEEDEDQELLHRSDLPALAWASRVYRQGTKLKADFRDVPPQVVKILRAKRYKKMSSEVYDEPPEGVPGKGKMLRRVAFLGGDIPQIKSLADIPVPVTMSERDYQWRPTTLRFRSVRSSKIPGVFTVFAEVVMPSREEMCAKLQQLGFDQSILDGMRDEQLAEILRVYGDDQGGDMEPDNANGSADIDADSQGDQQPPPDQGQDDPSQMDDAMAGGGAGGDMGGSGGGGMGGDPSGGEPIRLSEYADGDLPEPQGDDDKQKFQKYASAFLSRGRKMFEKYHGRACQMSDFAPQSQATDANDPSKTQAMSDIMPKPSPAAPPPNRQPQQTTITHKYSEADITNIVNKAVAEALKTNVSGSLNELKKFAEEEKAAKKKEAVEAFCEAAIKAGKLTATQYKAKAAGGPGGTVYHRLMRADSRQVVAKFTEKVGGKDRPVQATELDLQMREIERLPSLFAERFKDGGGDAIPSGDEEKKQAIIEKFHELAPSLKKAGVPADEKKFVETWMKAPEKELNRLLGKAS